jgi:hypothetical protein
MSSFLGLFSVLDQGDAQIRKPKDQCASPNGNQLYGKTGSVMENAVHEIEGRVERVHRIDG